MDPVRHLKISLAVMAALLTAGTVGYMAIERWSVLDALYMTVITLSTVGFCEVHDLGSAGRIFTMLLIVGGVGAIGYIVSSVAQIMFEGQIQRLLGRKRVEKAIDELENHYIICGYGRIGSLVCRELAAKPTPFVVVEKDELALERLGQDSAEYLIVRGDATLDQSLLKAGIKKAKGLISVVASDTENVFITLTARGLNPDLFILARASEDGADVKLKRAGANKVISPYQIGGNRIAQAILRPNVVDFIEIATCRERMELQIEEFSVASDSVFVGQALQNSGLRDKTMVVGIRKEDGSMAFNPAPHTVIEARDTLIVLGEPTAIVRLEQMLRAA